MTKTFTYTVDRDMRNILIKSLTQLNAYLSNEISEGNRDEDLLLQHENLSIMLKSLIYTLPNETETTDD